MTKPIEWLAGLTIGTIESVAPDELTVLLDVEAPQATALNAGTPTAFPRINGYVLIPGQAGAVVGQIAWLGVERSAFPKRPGLKDFGLIDLPYPLRKMRLTPVGTLARGSGVPGEPAFRLERGLFSFPSVGDAVTLPTQADLLAIVEATGSDTRVDIGRSPLNSGAKITVDPDKIFGRHVAVLGNTGSGKSCTVAGLVRWSLEATMNAAPEGTPVRPTNARFIILDPNGEYGSAFKDFGTATKVFRVATSPDPAKKDDATRLVVPAWMWNAQEWFTFTAASPKTQQPMLLQALHELRAGQTLCVTAEERAVSVCFHMRIAVQSRKNAGDYNSASFPKWSGCHDLLESLVREIPRHLGECSDGAVVDALQEALVEGNAVLARCKNSKGYKIVMTAGDLDGVVSKLDAVIATRPATAPASSMLSPDTPVKFNVDELAGHLDLLAQMDQHAAAAQFVGFLNTRIRTLLSDSRIRDVIDPETHPTVEEWMALFLGEGSQAAGTIRIIDFSLVPSDVLHIIVAAVARLVFEALQRHRRLFGEELPTVLVLEEAHSFIHQGADDSTEVPTATQLCRRTFERIAREGRKFGLGLVLSSQRPSELSQTVLSQCNTFLLHRLVNDRDQDYVSRLVPDLLGDLLKELPSLPSQYAVLLGWASPIPKLVRINDLSREKRPSSEDPKFWDTWTGVAARAIDWNAVVSDWTGVEGSGSPPRKRRSKRRPKKPDSSEE